MNAVYIYILFSGEYAKCRKSDFSTFRKGLSKIWTEQDWRSADTHCWNIIRLE